MEREVLKRHPFQDTPQWRQQYETPGLGYPGNGLGAITGADPDWHDEEDMPRARRSRSQRQRHFTEEEDRRTVGDVLDQAGLTEKQRFVIELRHGMRGGVPLTLREIAELMGTSTQAVAQLEKAAKKKLEKVLDIGA